MIEEINTEKPRTKKQNASLQLGCRFLADEFNAAGLDMKKVLKPGVDIPWTGESIREYLFNGISEVMFDGKTSSELNTKEIQAAWEVLIRHTGEKFGVTVPWPDRYSQSLETINED